MKPLHRRTDRPDFILSGTVGKICQFPHDRYVGEAAVVLVHLPTKSQQIMSPWYVLFDDRKKITKMKTGDYIKVSGWLERVSDQLEKHVFGKLNAHLKPMGIYLWGHTWQVLSQK